jgi:hypothetical protein
MLRFKLVFKFPLLGLKKYLMSYSRYEETYACLHVTRPILTKILICRQVLVNFFNIKFYENSFTCS